MTSSSGSLSMGLRSRIAMGWKAVACVWGLLLTLPVLAMADSVRFNIAAQPLPSALKEFAAQANMQLLYRFEAVESATANPVIGDFDKRAALELLLDGAGLEAIYSKDDAATIRPTTSATHSLGGTNGGTRLAQADAPVRSNDVSRTEQEPTTPNRATANSAIFEVLVTAEKFKTLNMDIKRSQDDVQPYVIFTRERIEQSGANNIEDFLKKRLPMNTVAGTASQAANVAGTLSQVNLRGLGTNQTLILVDGHRASRPVSLTGPQQSNLNGIPLAAIERIEVLPTTASGIYGGNATGGVINVVLRRDYVGVESRLKYESPFDADAAGRQADLSAGFALEGGKTNVLLAGSYSETDELLVGDRNFVQRARAAIQANNGGFFFNASSPPLGATTNIRSSNGSPLFGPGTPNFTSVPVGYAGGGGLAPLAANAGRYNLDLAQSAESPGGARSGLLNGPTAKSLSATVRREFSNNLKAFLEASGSDRISHFSGSGLFGGQFFSISATAPNNPFGQAISVTVPSAARDATLESKLYNRRAVAGIIYELPAQWHAEADYTWDRSRSSFMSPTSASTEGGEISSGSVDVLRDTNLFPVQFSGSTVFTSFPEPFETTLKNATLRFAGPVGSLPGGAPTLSLMLEHSDEFFDDATQNRPDRFYPHRSQVIKSAYLELRTPVVSERNAVPGIQELELQIAGRYDDYEIDTATNFVPLTALASIIRVRKTFSSTNPTLGLKFRPLKDIALRASYGTGFRPPSTEELTPLPFGTNPGGLANDPRRGGEPTGPVQLTGGGSLSLVPEESDSRSIGIVLTPRFVPDLRLSVDYTRIKKTDNIVTLDTQQIIDNESLLPAHVTRGPVPPGDPFGVGPITALDLGSVNIARTDLEAFDVAIDYRKATASMGTFELFVAATRNTHYKTRLIPQAPVVESVGVTRANPLKFKGNAGLTWSYGKVTLGWTTQYFDSYTLTNLTQIANQGSTRIPSQTYHDAFARYRFDGGGTRLWNDLEIQVGVQNVFDEEPPFDASNTTYFYSSYSDPRLATYYLSVKAVF